MNDLTGIKSYVFNVETSDYGNSIDVSVVGKINDNDIRFFIARIGEREAKAMCKAIKKHIHAMNFVKGAH